MNIVLIILSVIAGIIVLFLIAALFTKKGYSIQRDIVINKPVAAVFDYVRHLKNQDNFSKWVMMDPNMTKTYRGTDGNVGFAYAWEGNKQAGKGEQEIMGIEENKKVAVEVKFEKPFKATASTPFSTLAINVNQTKVIWGMTSEMKYPMNGIMIFMNIEKMLGKDLDISLNNLKSILEK